MKIIQRLKLLLARHRMKVVVAIPAFAGVGIVIVVINYLYIASFGKFMFRNSEDLPIDTPIGIVLGGGIKDGKPKPLLKDRLDTAARLLEENKVSRLVVSGDNRFVHYNEPEVMFKYLTQEKQVDPSKIQRDNAGRSTYETCERAKKIFSVEKIILISESTHLPRAIYLCRSFGIETYGYASDGQSSAGLRIGQRWREVMARTKATLNIYVIGENTILGDKINL